MNNNVSNSDGKGYDKLIRSKVLVYGGTVGGIAAALVAARMGCDVVLIERGDHFGAMTASGLGAIDILRKNSIGGIFYEFIKKTQEYYIETYGEDSEQYRLTYDGYWMEPHVAEALLDDMISSQERLAAFKRYELLDVVRENNTVVASVFRNRDNAENVRIDHEIAIDGTYEGDLAAMAGVAYRVGREGREEYDEQLAGEIFYDWRPNQQKLLSQSTGQASEYIQAYCFRVTIIDDPAIRIPFPKPSSYEEFYPFYKALFKDFESGRVRRFANIIYAVRMSNRKYGSNGLIEALTSMNLSELNVGWSDGDWETREDILRQYREYTEGLWYFLQNDLSVPWIAREEAKCFGLPPDEYPDEGHFPWQLYVRQSRRIIGEYVFTEHDCIPTDGRERPHIHEDSIAVCEHNFDCHPCRNRDGDGSTLTSDGFELLEGAIWFRNKMKPINRPSSLPYRIIVPEKVDGLLVPVAMSGSHVAFTTLRMEPVWMATGHAAGVAAAQAIAGKTNVREIDIRQLQETLVNQGQVLAYFEGLSLDDPDFASIQLKAVEGDYPYYDVTELRLSL